MPYINQHWRELYDPEIDKLSEIATGFVQEEMDGHLNYIITSILLRSSKPKRYSDYARLLGCLEAAKLELYRRAIGPYEDTAIEKNGDLNEY